MSATPPETRTDHEAAGGDLAVTPGWLTRRLALAAAAGVVLTYLSVLWHVTTVVGGRLPLAAVSVAAVVLATVSARYVGPRTAATVGGSAFGVGVLAYVLAIPRPLLAVATVDRVVNDVYVLLTGNLSVLQIVAADVWAVGMAPAPAYLTWYLALRRAYDRAALVGGVGLFFFALTGDASGLVTLAGATGVLALVGLGTFEEHAGTWRQVGDLGLLLAASVLAARLVTLVPSRGIAKGPSAAGGSGGSPTLEGSLLATRDRVSVFGAISLSAKVRWTVEADRPALWHAGAYDRYTGSDWVQSGGTAPYPQGNRLASPPGPHRELVQRFTARSSIATLPAAWKPVLFRDEPPVRFRVTSTGGLRAGGSLSTGDGYEVTSQVPDWSTDRLRGAGTDYPAAVRERYLQVPDSTPGRVGERAAEVAADADTAYDAAVAIQRWLGAQKAYSLQVGSPSGDIVDAFVFRMSRGYCVHFASAMAVMLRTLDIAARFAVGYTPGERVGDGRWTIRGYNSHAWVEVFFPDIGWVPFDPTPAGPRRDAESSELADARRRGEAGVDTEETTGSSPTPTPTPTAGPTGSDTPFPTDGTPSGLTPDVGAQGNVGDLEDLPTRTPGYREQLVAGGESGPASPAGPADSVLGDLDGVAPGRDRLSLLAGVAGVAIGAYRFRLLERGLEAARLRFQRRTDSPTGDAIRAFERLELLLGRRHRPRSEGETARTYLASLSGDVDGRARRVAEVYEAAYYGESVTREEADEAIALVDELVGEAGRLP